MSVTFIILSAGKLRIKGESRPAPMISYHDEMVIDRQISAILEAYKKPDIIIGIGYQAQTVTDYISQKYPAVRIIENKNHKSTSSIETLRLSINATIESNLFVIHGDRIFSKESIVTSKKSYLSYIESRKSNPGVGITHQGSELLNMSYGLNEPWSEILFVSRKDYRKFKHGLNHLTYKQYSIPEYINLGNVKFEAVKAEGIVGLKNENIVLRR